jgi:Flp pilus assembly pilin Flp
MKIREFLKDDFGITALHFTMWLAIIGLVVMVGIAALNSVAS